MRSMTIQAKIAGSHYDEINYIGHDGDRLITARLSKTPRPGTTFQTIKKSEQIRATQLPPGIHRARTGTSRYSSTSRTSLLTAANASRAATAIKTNNNELNFKLNVVITETDDFLTTAKALFEYIYYCEGDVRKAMEIALQVQKVDNNNDWWWSLSRAKCYITLNLYRNAEDCLRRALKQSKHITLYITLINMYVCINQPLSALEDFFQRLSRTQLSREVGEDIHMISGGTRRNFPYPKCAEGVNSTAKNGLTFYPNDTCLMLEEARIHEAMGNSVSATRLYRSVAGQDATNIEAIASIGVYNFYNDQPEIALRYYRRLLATTPLSAELYNNIGLCCLYCNQWDVVMACFRYTLYLAIEPELKADVWFNLAHVALSTGDLELAKKCLRASLSINSNHQSALDTLKKVKRITET